MMGKYTSKCMFCTSRHTDDELHIILECRRTIYFWHVFKYILHLYMKCCALCTPYLRKNLLILKIRFKFFKYQNHDIFIYAQSKKSLFLLIYFLLRLDSGQLLAV